MGPITGSVGCNPDLDGACCTDLLGRVRGAAVYSTAGCELDEVYILNRDSAARLTISSPLEAHKSDLAKEAKRRRNGQGRKDGEGRCN